MHALLNKLFGPPEEINGGERCPTYLYRWPLFRFAWGKWGKIYLHHFVADDWSLDLHDHPKRFISIGLKGGYIEWTPCTICTTPCGFNNRSVFSAPWTRSFPATHIHRIEMFRDASGKALDCWTLVIVLRSVRDWGFWHRGQFIPWRAYVGSDVADEMKACN